jgi:hypothetical protein
MRPELIRNRRSPAVNPLILWPHALSSQWSLAFASRMASGSGERKRFTFGRPSRRGLFLDLCDDVGELDAIEQPIPFQAIE